MMRRSVVRVGLATLMVFALLCFFGLGAVSAQTDKEKDIPRPERGIAVYTEYSGILVAPGESVRMELTAENKGRTDENIQLKISQVAKGWKASIKAPNFTVNAVPVPATKNRTLTFLAEPDKSVKPGTYQFQVDAQTADGKFTSTQMITATVREKAPISEEIQVTTSYPVF